MRVESLNAVARAMISDSKGPNVFFVSLGADVQMITTDYNQAHQYWHKLADTTRENLPILQDRWYGTICSVEKNPSFPNGYTVFDYSTEFLRFKLKAKTLGLEGV